MVMGGMAWLGLPEFVAMVADGRRQSVGRGENVKMGLSGGGMPMTRGGREGDGRGQRFSLGVLRNKDERRGECVVFELELLK